MVSLKKEQHIREYTPEHLMDEEEAVRKFCPPRDDSVNRAEISVKKNDESNINFKKSMHYNPFAYIRSEKDILKLVNTIISTTKNEGDKSGDDFWIKVERLLYTAYIGYIYYEAPEEKQNFNTLVEMIESSEVREDDENFKNPIDLLFERLENKNPSHFAVKQYKQYKLVQGKTAKSILISCGARLASLDIQKLCELMAYDNKVEKYLAAQGKNTENPPTDSDEDKGGTAFNILIIAICILFFVAGFSMIIYAGYIGLKGLTEISDTMSALNILLKMLAAGAVGCTMIATPRLIKRLFDCQRW